MNKTYLCNAFSIAMVKNLVEKYHAQAVRFKKLSVKEVAATDFESVIGHPDTAAVLSTMLGKEVAYNRANISLKNGETLLVAQLNGGRLPEGTTTLPEGFSFEFFKVELL